MNTYMDTYLFYANDELGYKILITECNFPIGLDKDLLDEWRDIMVTQAKNDHPEWTHFRFEEK